MRVITKTSDLEALCQEMAQQPFVAVDTEFMRETTYWPKLCLIQAAADGVEAIIDPMAPDIDLDPFLKVLSDRETLKIFHAARQDVEIFFHMTGEAPAPLFDTQIAAMACGFGEQIGYEPLVRTLVGASIDKAHRFTDWSRRPLSQSQLSYALSDVTHLRDAYPILKSRLEKDGRHAWVEEEMNALRDASLYNMKPEDAWARLKLRGVRPGDFGPIMKLAEWREREAQEKNLPRNRIIKDDAIFELARLKPATTADLAGARAIPTGFERSRAAAGILEAVAEGRAIPRDKLPKLEKPERKTPPPPDVVELFELLPNEVRGEAEAEWTPERRQAVLDDVRAIIIEALATRGGKDS